MEQFKQLIFSPSQGFQSGTEYMATLTSLVLKKSVKKYSIGDDKVFHFHTAPLRITGKHLSYTKGKNASNVIVQLDVNFNYEVKLDEGAGKTLSLQFTPVNNLDEETLLNIKLGKGFPKDIKISCADNKGRNTNIEIKIKLMN